ncbi:MULTISPECIES: hypothetical protein [Halomonadaceae]|uniref:hypothetical protein n=1 Tax=Halomonadaceae TaxID=28256 RepID=UPI00110E814D|nr:MULTISPECIES: hypothetical protein [Halomonas]UEQ03431.1 hypothetical protein LMS44_19470 [Halomonas profundus]TMU28749.1 hypothetical protein E0L35_01105 [Halomonas sp. ATBC28]CAD5258010.1 conserved hypothetical protein [Halomonas sp. 59]CAD5258233.1 conserved hypothetical protein [Halomonas sp. 113]CAD5272149.1 conserved hypothetical protein [Halomonas sp. I3]
MTQAEKLLNGRPRALSTDEVIEFFNALAPYQATAGPLTIEAKVAPGMGQVVVKLALAGREMGKRLLGYTEPELILNLANDEATATGKIKLELKAAPHFSSLEADVSATQSGQTFCFKGDIASWQAKGLPVVGHYVTQLDATLTANTTVRGVSANTANFEFLFQGSAVAAMTTTQLAPVQVYPDEISAGNLHIAKGAKITLAVPTEIGPGMLFLQCFFKTATTPETQVSASVANIAWPQVAAPQRVSDEAREGDPHD